MQKAAAIAREPLEIRTVDFDFDPAVVPRDWYDGDPCHTAFLNALSLMFPAGETFFVNSVKLFRTAVAGDDALHADVDGFIGQEAMHGKGHRGLNELLLAHGYPSSTRLEAHIRWVLRRARRLPPRAQLAVTVALEHFTATLAEDLMADDRLSDPMHPQVRRLWLWHALEESEHKHVAFDVYQRAGGSYAERSMIMVATTLVFLAEVVHVQARLMADTGALYRPWRWRRMLRAMFVRPGYVRRLIPRYLAYYRPGFHPNDRDNSEMIWATRRRLFGTRRIARAG